VDNLLFKEKLVVAFCWGASFFFLGTSWYGYINSGNSIGNLIVSTGVAITLFSTGLIPKIFYMSLKSAFKDMQSPILVNVKTQQYMTLTGVIMSSLGLGMQLLP